MGLPIELEGADGAEGGQHGVEDCEIDVVSEVDPGEDEEGVEGDDEGRGEVVEGFGCLISINQQNPQKIGDRV